MRSCDKRWIGKPGKKARIVQRRHGSRAYRLTFETTKGRKYATILMVGVAMLACAGCTKPQANTASNVVREVGIGVACGAACYRLAMKGEYFLGCEEECQKIAENLLP